MTKPPTITIESFNNMDEAGAHALMERACGASDWITGMLEARPFETIEAIFSQAEKIWWNLEEADWLEAFTHHPQIGDVSELRKKFQKSGDLSEQEQAGVEGADDKILDRLASQNRLYLERFGFIFIVFATGKSAAEMLALLEKRIHNRPEIEVGLAAEEQLKITRLRLRNIFMGQEPKLESNRMKSPITTHILDTSIGRPAAGVQVHLSKQSSDGQWTHLAQGFTNEDGRISDLLEPGTLTAGLYRIVFEVEFYFAKQGTRSFYPFIPIVFEILATDEHYHVPLLLNPYGYSTYRGS